jgi:hypothetical protein
MAQSYYATYKRFNGTDWDTFYFTTVASQVAETSTRKWLTDVQQGWVNDYLDPTTYNQVLKLVQLDASGLVPFSSVPSDLGYLYLTGGTMTGDINMNGNDINNIANLSGQATTDMVLGLGSDTYMTLKYNATEANRSLLMSRKIDMNNLKIVNLANATNAQDAATWGQVQSLAADGLKPMPLLQAATTTAVTLSGLQMIDDYQLLDGDRLLVKDQVDPLENGVYSVASSAWTRIDNQSTEGYYGQVLNGTVNRGTWYYAAEHPTVSGAFEWLIHSVPDEYNVITNAGLELIGMNFGIIESGVTNSMLAGSISNDKLLNLAVTKISDWASSDLATPLASTTTQGLDDHISNLYGMVKTIKGTATSVADAGDTILTLRSDLDTKNRTYIGSSAPQNTGYTSGDLFFQYTIV